MFSQGHIPDHMGGDPRTPSLAMAQSLACSIKIYPGINRATLGLRGSRKALSVLKDVYDRLGRAQG